MSDITDENAYDDNMVKELFEDLTHFSFIC